MSAETSWYGFAPGDGADGNVTQLALQYSANTAVYDGSFRLGPEKSALGPGPRARIMHVYPSQEKSGLNWIRYDAWALPKPVSVEYDDSTGKLTWPKSPVEGLKNNEKQELFEAYEVVAPLRAKPGEWIVLETVVGGEDSYEAVIDAARLAKEGAGPDVCVRVRDTVGYTSPEGCPERLGELVFRLTTLTSSGDPLVVQHLFGALAKPAPVPISTCLATPTACYFVVLPFAGSGAAVAWVPLICTEEGLNTARVNPGEVIRTGTCALVGGQDVPSEQGIPAMYQIITATSLKAVSGGTYKAGADSQPNIMNWIDLEAAFPGNTVTGTLELTSYFQFKSDGVWTPDYNPTGPIPNTPPRFATVTFEGTRVK